MLYPISIRTKSKSACICCGAFGTYIYKNLQDKLFSTPGMWSLKRCNNDQCGLLWLDSVPIDEDIYLAYQNYYTHQKNSVLKASFFSKCTLGYQASKYKHLLSQTTYLQRVLGNLLARFNFFKEHMDYPFAYFKHLQKSKDLNKVKLLELGVGSGETLKLFSDWGLEATGLDFDPLAVKYAKSQGLKVFQGDIFSQQFGNESFDAIFSSHVIEHVDNPIKLMQESIRVLKLGGVFVAVTPNALSKLHQYFKSNWRGLEPPRHLHIFTYNALLIAARESGFSNIKVISSNRSAVHIFYASTQLKNDGYSKVKHSIFTRYLAYLAGVFVNLMHRFSPFSGEELVLIAYK